MKIGRAALAVLLSTVVVNLITEQVSEVLFRLTHTDFLTWQMLAVMPWLHEVCKRLAARWLKADQGITGLGFGLLMGAALLTQYYGWLSVVQPLTIVALHWACGRWASRRGLGVAIVVHFSINISGYVAAMTGILGLVYLVPLVVALLLLALSFRPALDAQSGAA